MHAPRRPSVVAAGCCGMVALALVVASVGEPAGLARADASTVLLSTVEKEPDRAPDAMLPDGTRYYGPLVDGRMHGEGRIYADDGLRYTGPLVRGVLDGEGLQRLPDGSVYRGGFRGGLRDGHGVLELAAGGRYTGGFARDTFNGVGRLERVGGVVLEGVFRDGNLNGRGVYVDGDARYEGEFRHSVFHGEGTYHDGAGNTYAGRFDNGELVGEGRFRTADGTEYEGQIRDWKMHGQGRFSHASGAVFVGEFQHNAPHRLRSFTAPDGAHYEGEFEGWQPHGRGTYLTADGDRYEGALEFGEFHGQGVLVTAAGDRYEGEFRFGEYHGTGTLTRAEPDDSGASTRTGQWRYGRPHEPGRDASRRSGLEAALYGQAALLEQALARVPAGDPSRIELFVLAAAGDGREAVFRREVAFLASVLDSQLANPKHRVTLMNDDETVAETPLATRTSFRAALAALAQRMDLEQDILLVYLTSHGSETHELTLRHPDLTLNSLPATELRTMLEESGIRWRVVVVSACYSGGFVDALADERTLVIAASRRDRPSFGCADDSDLTYFGRAFLEHGIPTTESFAAAFEAAREWVSTLEREEGKTPSEPQMHAPEAVLHQLRAWRQGLSEAGRD
ncbi:MAG: peptidase C13 [Ectothiorhodospiraceae bacterium]|nr:peptidase C13 [Ectothiorhodospiraceae bacterium]